MFDPPRIYPSRHAWPISTANLDDAPHNAERIRLVNRGTGFDKLSEFKSLSALWCYGIDQKKLTHISECTSLCNLYLDYQLRIDDLLPLQRLPRLDVLRLDSCSKITSLQRLSDLKQLTGLAIENFKNVHGVYLDKGTTFYETLDTITAEEASERISPDSATIAAQVEHVRFYLDVLDNYMRTLQSAKTNWREIWDTVGAVTPEEWEATKKRLRASHAAVMTTINSFDK